MAQQTAVEWLENKFQKFLSYYEGNHKAEPYTIQELSNDFEQAKQMEREQMEKAYKQRLFSDCQTFDQYYTKTYGTRLQNETNSTPNKIPPPPTPPPSRFLKEGKEPPKRNQLK